TASRPEIGVVVAQDATGVELLQLGPQTQLLTPGDRIEIQQQPGLLRRRDFGVKISAAPVVDNDGVHSPTNQTGEVWLTAGRHPLELDWFNQSLGGVLEVACQFPNHELQNMPDTSLWRAATNQSSGRTVFLPGLRVECYEGFWGNVPDFELLRPVKTGVVTNFDVQFRTQNEMSALRFTGFFDAPSDGKFIFFTRSDDGSLLFIGDPEVKVTKLGAAVAPAPQTAIIGESMTNLDERRWLSVAGRVSSVRPDGRGLDLELRSDRDTIRVNLADGNGLEPGNLMNARVRVRGVGRAVFNLDQRIVLGRLAVASARDLELLDASGTPNALPSPLVTALQVQTLRLAEARRGLPVHLHGVVTSVGLPYEHWLSIQDETRGIYVDTHALSNAVPECGEYWEIVGHSGAGFFAPMVVADRGTRLGEGRLPEPAQPTWNDLINGSMDAQWVEFQGLVTTVQSNTLSMLLPGGQITVQMEGHSVSKLKPLENSVVRIRGVLYAEWNVITRELRVGRIIMRNASVEVEIPAPANPFHAVLKTPRELLRFDAQAAAFRRIKVRGQVIYAGRNRIILTEDGTGLQILPAGVVNVQPGDMVEAVGYPEISGTAPVLREAVLRKTGAAALPKARVPRESELTDIGLDATRVRLEGKLLGWHFEQGSPVLEMQLGSHLYLARLASFKTANFFPPLGSRLMLEGVYLGQRDSQRATTGSASFELLLNSPADIAVLSQPSWWTLQHLLIIVGSLLVGLVFTLVWITQLRRVVEQRTAQLQRETRERARVERQHALETERSRIARDLHDDLGSSLTEIGALAMTGQRPQTGGNSAPALFHSIARKARRLIAALDVIVWAVDPEDNSLQSLADYLSGFAGEFLSHSGIACRFKVPVTFPPVNLDGRVRHEMLMVVKETLNNIVRHADATEVEFRMAVKNHSLDIAIADNGKGLGETAERNGHGLKNLCARLTKLGGTCLIESLNGSGTTVKIHLPLPNSNGATNHLSANANTTTD
ncbi:MAG TPA: ATP-binding protein, partial [Verrucomicrobiae bacterium]|nr:ATP-binding protein [Verrucomicrobiae bacterium]